MDVHHFLDIVMIVQRRKVHNYVDILGDGNGLYWWHWSWIFKEI